MYNFETVRIQMTLQMQHKVNNRQPEVYEVIGLLFKALKAVDYEEKLKFAIVVLVSAV